LPDHRVWVAIFNSAVSAQRQPEIIHK
jgi:hypothetical protein